MCIGTWIIMLIKQLTTLHAIYNLFCDFDLNILLTCRNMYSSVHGSLPSFHPTNVIGNVINTYKTWCTQSLCPYLANLLETGVTQALPLVLMILCDNLLILAITTMIWNLVPTCQPSITSWHVLNHNSTPAIISNPQISMVGLTTYLTHSM